MKCKPYSKTTVEIRTQLKTVKITSNIFAVYLSSRTSYYYEPQYFLFKYFSLNTSTNLFLAMTDQLTASLSARTCRIFTHLH